ncbi:MAG TPA: hypothetical protein VFT72_20605 [Opitutaceae bacterium]|nr:hypothetical protein [Opitutaceae bacterium]
MKPCLASLTVLLVGAILCGCSTPDSRIKDHQAAFAALSPEDQGRIRGGKIDVGYTPEMVLMALGDPDRKYTRTTAKGTAEVWAYRDKGPRLAIGVGVGGGSGHVGGGVGVATGGGDQRDDKVRVIFDNGRVSAIERSGR